MTATECAKSEIVILVDDQDRQIGLAEKLAAHEQNLLHRAFSAFIFRQGTTLQLLLQQRALHKYHCPGLWTNTCCSHPRTGETAVEAGQRRVKEELGIETTLEDIGWFKYNAHFSNGLSEHEIDHVLIGFLKPEQPLKLNPEEVLATRWITIEELEKEYAKNPDHFTQWLMLALERVKKAMQM
jgi:isopentenyl-diphosphate delta-isomerase